MYETKKSVWNKKKGVWNKEREKRIILYYSINSEQYIENNV